MKRKLNYLTASTMVVAALITLGGNNLFSQQAFAQTTLEEELPGDSSGTPESGTCTYDPGNSCKIGSWPALTDYKVK